MTDDLWGELPNAMEIETPAEILQEQASLLTRKTNHRLTAKIRAVERTFPMNDLDTADFHYDFVIIAPVLNNYTYSVLEIGHPVKLYPVMVFDPSQKRTHRCANIDVYRETIGSILQSTDLRQVIASLLKQSGGK